MSNNEKQKQKESLLDNDSSGGYGTQPEGATVKTPLDKRKVGAVLSCIFSEMFRDYALTPIWPLLVLLWFEEEDAGTYSGALTSAVYLGQAFGSPLWGFLADKLGRRISLLIGMSLSVCGLMVIGTATSYWTIYVAYMCMGVAVGTQVVAKTAMGDLTDVSNRTIGFAGIGVTAGCASFIAPLVSGYLYDVGGSSTYWVAHPILVLVMVIGSLDILAIAITAFNLPESLSTDTISQNQDLDPLSMTETSVVGLVMNIADIPNVVFSERQKRISCRFISDRLPGPIRNKVIYVLMVLGAMNSSLNLAWLTLFALLCSIELEFDPAVTGTFLSIYGGVVFGWQLLCYCPVVEYVGLKWSYILGLVGTLFNFIVTPMVVWMANADGGYGAGLYIVLGALIVIQAASSPSAAISASVMLTHATPAGWLGSINGVNQTFVALMQSFLAFLVGWAFSEWYGLPFAICIPYWSMAVVTVVFIILGLSLPKELNIKSKDKQYFDKLGDEESDEAKEQKELSGRRERDTERLTDAKKELSASKKKLSADLRLLEAADEPDATAIAELKAEKTAVSTRLGTVTTLLLELTHANIDDSLDELLEVRRLNPDFSKMADHEETKTSFS